MRQEERATTFRQLHSQRQRPLVLPNAWDAGSARVIESAGAAAVATTSAGVSWARGHRDGQRLSLAEVVDAVRSIVRVVSVPVSADIESGYGRGTPEDIAAAVRAVVKEGAVGINLEDGPGRKGEPLLTRKEQAERIRAARSAARGCGIELFINARTDVYLAGSSDPDDRFDEVVSRATSYLGAGADGIFVPAVSDTETIRGLVAAVDAPLNVMVGPGAPSVPELAALGVARVSLGPSIAQATMGLVHRASLEALSEGTYSNLESALTYGEADSLFADV